MLLSSLLLAALSLSPVLADAPKCNDGSKCPEDKPCCGQYGECGTGAYCLGGCDPLYSHSLDSCAPEPICLDKKYSWDSLDDLISHTEYLGNASAKDWMYSGYPKVEDGNLLMRMPNDTGSTLIANNHYIWYGNVKGKMKSSRGQGVVTAFILLSDVKDEIDYEFIGDNLTQVETNYYFQGILDWTHGGASAVDGGNTFEDWHTYEFDWTPDTIKWIIDGETRRTLNRKDTWNATTNQWEFPQTPSRLQMSLWPAGREQNAKGTVEWAGGLIDWDSQDMQEKGYYYATIGEVSIECYKPPKGANVAGDNSYIYTGMAGTNDTLKITDKGTVLASHQATGTNMSYSPSVSSTAPTGASTSNTVPEVHGGSGSEPGRSGGSGGSGNSGSDGGDSSTFSQGGDSSSNSGNGNGNGENSAPAQNILKTSLFAVLVAAVVLMTL